MVKTCFEADWCYIGGMRRRDAVRLAGHANIAFIRACLHCISVFQALSAKYEPNLTVQHDMPKFLMWVSFDFPTTLPVSSK